MADSRRDGREETCRVVGLPALSSSASLTPSGDPIPSEQDKLLTRDLVVVGRAMEIRVFDHLIIGDGRYFSFADEGLIEEYEMQAIL